MNSAARQTTGTSDPTYNLISVAYHSLQGAENYEKYAQDAQQEGDQELTDSSRRARALRVRCDRQIGDDARTPFGQSMLPTPTFNAAPRDLVHQLAPGIGLLKDARFPELRRKVEIDMAGNEDDRQRGVRGVNGSSEITSSHFRHRKICKNEIDHNSARDQPKRFPSTLRGDHCISDGSEHLEGEIEDRFSVVDDDIRLSLRSWDALCFD
ncbi:MAG: hypothetical protein JWL84_4848 [Rhodospirillales bacterium]|nr:hypothetical protein [Rhodospirillales bacterium]